MERLLNIILRIRLSGETTTTVVHGRRRRRRRRQLGGDVLKLKHMYFYTNFVYTGAVRCSGTD